MSDDQDEILLDLTQPTDVRMALQLPPRKPLARNLKNLAQRNSINPYLGQPFFYLNRP
jgi:hypothetical protein